MPSAANEILKAEQLKAEKPVKIENETGETAAENVMQLAKICGYR
jgi:hypothetical protein